MNTMTLADVAVSYVLLCGLFIAALVAVGIAKFLHRVFCEALDGAANDIG